MFDPDNYHWTQDECTQEGLSALKQELEARGVRLQDNGSSMYVSQRMGNKKVGYDLDLVLHARGEAREERVEYTSVSKESELEESPVKRAFLESLAVVSARLLRRAEGAAPAERLRGGRVTLPKTKRHTQTEQYRQTFVLQASKDRAKEILFSPELARAWSGGALAFSASPSLSCTHAALSLAEIAVGASCVSAKASFGPAGAQGAFSLSFALSERGGGTEIEVSSPDLPSNASERLTALLQAVYFSPIERVMRIPSHLK